MKRKGFIALVLSIMLFFSTIPVYASISELQRQEHHNQQVKLKIENVNAILNKLKDNNSKDDLLAQLNDLGVKEVSVEEVIEKHSKAANSNINLDSYSSDIFNSGVVWYELTEDYYRDGTRYEIRYLYALGSKNSSLARNGSGWVYNNEWIPIVDKAANYALDFLISYGLAIQPGGNIWKIIVGTVATTELNVNFGDYVVVKDHLVEWDSTTNMNFMYVTPVETSTLEWLTFVGNSHTVDLEYTVFGENDGDDFESKVAYTEYHESDDYGNPDRAIDSYLDDPTTNDDSELITVIRIADSTRPSNAVFIYMPAPSTPTGV